MKLQEIYCAERLDSLLLHSFDFGQGHTYPNPASFGRFVKCKTPSSYPEHGAGFSGTGTDG